MMCYAIEISAMIGNKTFAEVPDECSDVYINNFAAKQVDINSHHIGRKFIVSFASKIQYVCALFVGVSGGYMPQ